MGLYAAVKNPDWYSPGGQGIGGDYGGGSYSGGGGSGGAQPYDPFTGRGGSRGAAANYGPIIQALQGMGGGQPAQASAPLQATVNTATPNARIERVNAAQEAQFSGDMNAGNMMRKSSIDIRKQAEQERLAARQRAAASGTSGGGTENVQNSAISRAQITAQGGANADILNNAELRRASLGGQIVGQEATQQNLQGNQLDRAMAQQQMALNERQNERQNQIAQQEAYQRGIANQISIFKDLFSGSAFA